MPLRVRLLLRDAEEAQRLAREVLLPAGFEVLPEEQGLSSSADVVVVDPEHPAALSLEDPFPAVVGYLARREDAAWRRVLALGAVGVLTRDWTVEEAREIFHRAARRLARWHEVWRSEARRWLRKQPWLYLFEQLPVGLLMLDPADEVIWANAAAARWLHCEEQEGRWRCAPFSVEVQACLTQARRQSPAEGEAVLPESGQMLSLVAVAGEQHNGVLLFLQDVTTLKVMEAQRVQLIQNLSLQLRSPLTAVLGYAELLEHVGPLNEAQQQFVQRIGQSVRTMVDALEKLLEITRIESGVDTAWEVVPLAVLLRYTIEAMRPRAEDRGVRFEVRLLESLPAVQGPPARLRYGFDHLVGDAIRYTPEGGTVTLEAEVAEQQAIVRVKDTGVGIPQESLPHIFKKFYRAPNVATRFPGSGLGLSLVRSVVDQVGGRIWVESQEGQGTTFTVVLPVAAPGQGD
ncbi:MAG TPA: PAS domain-containing protein [Anaerolineales bacterium]|nr:PAS domain-containing protein [Anaerolineales bacterium]